MKPEQSRVHKRAWWRATRLTAFVVVMLLSSNHASAEKGYATWIGQHPYTIWGSQLYATEKQACEQGYEDIKPLLDSPSHYQWCAKFIADECGYGSFSNNCRGIGTNNGGELKQCQTGKLQWLGPSDGFVCADATKVDVSKTVGECNSAAGGSRVGNPCDPATGNKSLREVDYSGGGPFPLRFTRFYNSRPTRLTDIGRNWRHTFNRQIVPLVLDGSSTARAIRPDGKELYFSLSNGVWVSEEDVSLVLQRWVTTLGGLLPSETK